MDQLRSVISVLRSDLFGCVAELQVHDAAVALRLNRTDNLAGAICDDLVIACTRFVHSYCKMLFIVRITRRCIARLGIAETHYPAFNLLDAKIHAYREGPLPNSALSFALFRYPSNYAIHVLQGRMLELETQSYRDDLYDPSGLQPGPGAFEVYRRGEVLSSVGRTEEAELMYALALEAEPAFTLALRRLADLLRRRDPAGASALYAAALDYPPRLTYGSGQESILGVHRNFLLTRYGDKYVAYPGDVGELDLSSGGLRSVFRRFSGLLHMRWRLLRRRRSINTAQQTAHHDVTVSRNRTSILTVDRGHILFQIAIGFIVRKLRLLQFVLVDSSVEKLTRQIDRVDRLWLSRTHAK